MKNKDSTWWGTFELEEKQTLFWEIGPLLLGAQRLRDEWRIATDSLNDPDISDIKVAADDCPGFSKENLQFKRFVFHKTDPAITLIPIVADRPQVSLADTPFFLPPNEHVTIYVSSPVWVRIETAHTKIILNEFPSLTQSDTWHGPNTREGELCYASRTFCRTKLEELPIRSHRVLSPVIIHNNAKNPLLIEQLSLPLPFLSIYVDSNGSLWTEEIVVRNEMHHKHTIKQGKGAPQIAPEAILLTPPRHPLKPNNFISLFYSLLTE